MIKFIGRAFTGFFIVVLLLVFLGVVRSCAHDVPSSTRYLQTPQG